MTGEAVLRLNSTRLAFGSRVGAIFLVWMLLVGREGLAGRSGWSYCAIDRTHSGSSRTRHITFNSDVAPIIFRHCSGCHHPGEVAPFSLMTYQDVKVRAELVSLVTENRYMPPWGPEPGYATFKNVRRLTSEEIATIKQWVAEGTTQGNAEDLPTPPKFVDGWQLGEPDLVLKMPKAYEVAAGGSEFYRCFPIPTGLTTNKNLKALEFRPSGHKVVHHAILVQDEHQAGRRLEAAPGQGYPCGGGFGFAMPGMLAMWTAGTMPTPDPEGVAVPLKKGSDLVIQIHFRPGKDAESEQARIGLYFSKGPPARTPVDLALASYDIDIPAGAKDYKLRAFSYVPFDVEAFSIFAHAHYLAREVRASATLPNGTAKPLLWIKNWAFDWQENYWFVTPVLLPQGTRLDMEFTYDNSSENPRNPNHPPRRVTWGFLTTDEMGEIHLRAVALNGSPGVPTGTGMDAH